MAAIPAWATQKLGPLPVWGWGALALSGGVGLVLYRRRSTSSTGPTLSGAGTNPAFGDTSGGGMAGGGGGGGDPTFGTGDGFGPATPPTAAQPAQAATPAPTTPSGDAPAPAVAISPSMLGGGYEASRGVVSNPVGSAARAALASGGSYTPSLTDYATEQPGGIQTVQAGLPGTQPNQGLTYTILGTGTGTGPVVPAAQRKAGERYDALGRVIL